MATLAELLVKIGVDDDGIDKKLSGVADKVESNLSKVRDAGERVTDVGKTMTVGVTTPLVGIGTAALKVAGDFESSMNDVRAVTGATGTDFQNMSDLAREMGSTTQFSASESADAMSYLGMAGLDANEIMEALPGTLSLAAAGGMELADAADVSTNVLAGMNMEVSELGHLNDVLAEASRSANTDIGQLGMGMKQVAPVASGLGFTLEDTTAALGFLADAGIQGEQGGTLLRSAMSTLISPTAAAGEALDSFGVKATEADGSARALPDILRDMENAGMDATDMMNIFGTEVGPAMISLLNRGGDELEEFSGKLEASAGASEEMADIKMEGLNGSLKSLSSAAEGLMLAIAESGLLETITGLVEKVTAWVQSLSQANPELIKWATLIGAIVAAIGPLLVIVGTLISAVGNIGAALKFLAGVFRVAAIAKALFSAALWASPITWIIMGIIALIAVIVLIIVYWDEIKEATGAAWDWIVDKLAAAWDWIKATAASVWGSIKAFFAGLWDSIKSTAAAAWDWVVDKISSAWSSATSLVSSGVSRVLGFIQGLAAIPGRVGGFFRGMVTAAATQISNLLSRVREIPGKVKSAVGNLGSLLLNAGKQIIRGLINGVTSMVGNLKGKFNEITGMIPDWKGPMRVDRVLLAPTGEAIMGGLETGIESGLPGLRSTLRGVTSEIPRNVNASVRHTGGQNNTLTLDVTGADQEMVRLFRKMIRDRGGNVQTALGSRR